jgi:hypothetical protein
MEGICAKKRKMRCSLDPVFIRSRWMPPGLSDWLHTCTSSSLTLRVKARQNRGTSGGVNSRRNVTSHQAVRSRVFLLFNGITNQRSPTPNRHRIHTHFDEINTRYVLRDVAAVVVVGCQRRSLTRSLIIHSLPLLRPGRTRNLNHTPFRSFSFSSSSSPCSLSLVRRLRRLVRFCSHL